MSLAPSTDLVLEVSHAADPTRAAAVVDKLKSLAAQGANSPADFAAALDAADTSSAAGVEGAASKLPIRSMGKAQSVAEKAQTKLASVFLTQFVSEMLPKDTPSAYGDGYAGDMWRSMLAEKVADEMAASGRLGIAEKLFGKHPLSSSQKLFGADHPHDASAAQTAQASANALSAPQAADIQSGAVLFNRMKAL